MGGYIVLFVLKGRAPLVRSLLPMLMLGGAQRLLDITKVPLLCELTGSHVMLIIVIYEDLKVLFLSGTNGFMKKQCQKEAFMHELRLWLCLTSVQGGTTLSSVRSGWSRHATQHSGREPD